MATSTFHEGWKHILTLMIACLAEELDVEMTGLGNATIREKDKRKGFEADACYYTQHRHKVMPLRKLDFRKDPPPDLALEIEYSRPLLPILPIYAAFKVPEIWRYNGSDLTVLVLDGKGAYHTVPRSPTFPTVEPGLIAEFVRLGDRIGHTTLLKQFRQKIRQTTN